MRFLLAASGTYGDVAPFVALGMELQKRGHEVLMAVNPFFIPMVQEKGLPFRAVETWREADAILNRPDLRRLYIGRLATPWLVRELMIPGLGRRYLELKALIAEWRPDLVLTHLFCLDTNWAADDNHVPWASALLSPVTVLSADQLGYFHGLLNLTGAPLWLRKYGKWRLRLLARWLVDSPVNRLRKELGLPRQKGALLERIHDGKVTLGLWSAHYRPPASDDPPRLRICGFPWFEWNWKEGQAESLRQFLDAGEPPIVFALGTAHHRVVENFFETAAEACAELGRRGLFLTGNEREPPLSKYGPLIRSYERVPSSEVLPRASLAVYHGGIGTTAQAMRAGCPSLVVPFVHDQFDNGVRVTRLGLGERVGHWRLTLKKLAAIIDRVINDRAVKARCEVMKDKLKLEDGGVEAARILEHCLSGE